MAPVRSPDDVARVLGYDPGRITKTLLLKSTPLGAFCIAVLPVHARADLRALAQRLGAARCSVATASELEQTLGHPSGGVSPLSPRGMPVFLDAQLKTCETVLVGAGERGVEVELSPSDLAVVSRGEWVAFSQPT
jgi:Cys-tRNA(Pro)/Cys-tRNA(Cys) deacylase